MPEGARAISSSFTYFKRLSPMTLPPGDVTIGQVARTFGWTLRLIRHYEEENAIVPYRVNGARMFSENEAEKFYVIEFGRRLGIGVKEIVKLINVTKVTPEGERIMRQIDRLIAARKSELDTEIEGLRKVAQFADEAKCQLTVFG